MAVQGTGGDFTGLEVVHCFVRGKGDGAPKAEIGILVWGSLWGAEERGRDWGDCRRTRVALGNSKGGTEALLGVVQLILGVLEVALEQLGRERGVGADIADVARASPELRLHDSKSTRVLGGLCLNLTESRQHSGVGFGCCAR